MSVTVMHYQYFINIYNVFLMLYGFNAILGLRKVLPKKKQKKLADKTERKKKEKESC